MNDSHKNRTLVEAIQSRALHRKGITYIYGDIKEEFIEYKDIYNTAIRILHKLQIAGMRPLDELVFQIQDPKHFIYIFWACLLGKIIPVPVSIANNDEYRMKLFNIWKVLNNPYLATDLDVRGKSKVLAEDPSNAQTAQEMAGKTFLVDDLLRSSEDGQIQSVEPEDIAFVQFSSGSTGEPKGVILTHENLLTNIYAIINCAEWCADDVILCWMPLTHDLGMIGCHLAPLVHNMSQLHIPTPLFIRRPSLWLKKASEHRVTLLQSPNFGYKYFLAYFKPEMANDWDLSCVRIIFNGAEPISADISWMFLDQMEPYGLKRSTIYPVYGMAEASLAVSFPHVEGEFVALYVDRNQLRVGESVVELSAEDARSICFVEEGYPVDDCSVRICGDDDVVLEEGMIGHIQITGKNVTKGYYNNRKATEKVFTHDGWLQTGDLGFMREGKLVVTGRTKDIIFVNGHNYYPHDIERVAEGIEEIELGKIVACGTFNANKQKEEILAFVMFKKSNEAFIPLAKRLKTYINLRMGLNLDCIIPVRDIPKTTSGKVQRYKLAQKYLDGAYDELLEEMQTLILTSNQKREIIEATTETEKKLLTICRDVLQSNGIGVHDNFLEIGISSLMISQIVAQLEELAGERVKPTDLLVYPTIYKLAAFIDSQQRSSALFSLTFPEDYFLDDSIGGFSRASCELTVQDTLLRNVREMSMNISLSLDTLFLGSFIFLLSIVSMEKEIPVNTMMHDGYTIRSLSVNMESYDEIQTFFTDLSQRIKSGKQLETFPLLALDNLSLSKRKRTIIPLFGLYAFTKKSLHAATAIDLLVELQERSDSVTVTCLYNSLKLDKHKIEEFVFNYQRFLVQVSEKKVFAGREMH